MGKPALFMDRDGIFNELIWREGNFHSPRNWSEVKHFPLNGLEKIKELGFQLIMVTNQPDIERKIISQHFIDELHHFYQNQFFLDAIYVCPFSSNEHPLKKPNPGMFFLAEKERGLDLSKSYLLGDTEKDTLAAKNAGIQSILWNREYNKNIKADFRITQLLELEPILLNKA